MSETTNEPPAGQTWDETLRQWVPAVAVPRVVARAEYKDSSAPYIWKATSIILSTSDFDGDPYFVNCGYDVAYDENGAGDRGLLLTESGLVTVSFSAIVGLTTGSAANFTAAYAQVYAYPIAGTGVGAFSELPVSASGSPISSTIAVKACGTVQAYVNRNTWLPGGTHGKNVGFGAVVVAGSAGGSIAFKELQLVVTFQPC